MQGPGGGGAAPATSPRNDKEEADRWSGPLNFNFGLWSAGPQKLRARTSASLSTVVPVLLGHPRSKSSPEEAGPPGALVPWGEGARPAKKGSPVPTLSRRPLPVTSPYQVIQWQDFSLCTCHRAPCLPPLEERRGERPRTIASLPELRRLVPARETAPVSITRRLDRSRGNHKNRPFCIWLEESA